MSQPTSLAKPAGKLVFLESARGVAALIVVLYHLSLAFVPHESMLLHPLANASASARWTYRILQVVMETVLDGPFAVRFFFVLSGFVLSLSYFRSRDISVLRSATLRRFPRLAVPVAATILLSWAMLACVPPLGAAVAAITNQRPDSWVISMTSTRISLLAALGQALYGAIFQFSWKTTINGSLWTMNVELFNSFIVFALLPMVIDLPRRFSIYAGLSLLLIVFKQPYTVDFVVGMALADLAVNHAGNLTQLPQRPRLAAALLVVSGALSMPLMYGTAHIGEFLLAAQTPLAAAALIALLISPPLQRILQSRVLSFLGRISFSVYLIHLPILSTVGLKTYLLCRQSGHSSHAVACLGASVCVLGLTIAAATLMHRWFESAGISLGRGVDRWINESPFGAKSVARHDAPAIVAAA